MGVCSDTGGVLNGRRCMPAALVSAAIFLAASIFSSFRWPGFTLGVGPCVSFAANLRRFIVFCVPFFVGLVEIGDGVSRLGGKSGVSRRK